MKLLLFAPELLLLAGSLALFVYCLGDKGAVKARNTAIIVSVLNVVLCLFTLGESGHLFYDAYEVDLFSQLFKLMISFGLAAVCLFGKDLKDINPRIKPEYYLFLALSSLGLMMMVSSVELLSFFIALELSSYSLYLLVPMRDDRQGLRVQMESAIKYVLFGVVATGIMLFGMSYLFGLTGTTYFSELMPALYGFGNDPVALTAIAMVMCGLFFKLAVFPFHFWVPDVYEGAANETTAFIATVPKLGAVALLIRITMLTSPSGQAVITMLVTLAVCSMFYGNLTALVQKDLKRMLGFSGIAHAGFVLLGLLTLEASGYAASMYYIFGYVLMTLAVFLVICTVSRNGENVAIADLAGLYKRAPILALTIAVGMFAMAGIPPFVGFMGKFMLLAGALTKGHLALVILAAINTAIAIYYYLSVVRVAFTTEPEDRPMISVDGSTRVLSVILMVLIIAMGVMPAQILEMATMAVKLIL